MTWKSTALQKALPYALPLLAFVFLLVHGIYYLPFIADDTLISLRYSARLLHGQGLTWTDGHPVEGYSNLMWVLLIALLGAFGIDLVDASRILGVACMTVVIGSVSIWYLRRGREPGSVVGLAIALAFFVGVGPVAIWAIAGLEQPLVAAGLALAIPLYWRAADSDFRERKSGFIIAFILGILCLTRPDAPLFVVALSLATLLHRSKHINRQRWIFIAILISLPVFFYGGQIAFRRVYYGEWVANTALVKLTPSWLFVYNGIIYILDAYNVLFPMGLCAIIAIVAGMVLPIRRSRFIPLLLIAGMWLTYLIAVGGDIFPACRHIIPVIVVLVYALVEGVIIVWHYLHQYRWARTGLTVILIILQILTTTAQFGHISNQRAISERWEWDCRALGITLNQAFATQEPLVAVTAAGCLPYWSELPSIDMLGLNDYYLPRHKPADMGTGLLGHELGDGDYVLQRSPDMVIFHIGIQPIFLTGKQLSENPAFHQQYREISIRTAVEPYYTALVWVKVASNLIGYVQSDGEVRIPAYFLNAFETTTAWFDGDQLVISVDRDHPAGVVVDQLPASYTLTVVSRHAEQIKASVEPAEQGSRIVLTSEGTAPLAVEALVITDTSR